MQKISISSMSSLELLLCEASFRVSLTPLKLQVTTGIQSLALKKLYCILSFIFSMKL
jgi:hypothetical protein